MVGKYIREEVVSVFTMVRLNLKAAIALRTAFALQVVGMMLNNIAFITIWLFFSHAFGEINGWGSEEIIMLQGIVAFTFGLVFSMANGARHLPESIHNGVFDNFLTQPRILYFRVLFNKMDVSAIGDVFFGLLLMIIGSIMMELNFEQLFLLIIMLPASALIIVNMALLASLIAFRIPDSTEIQRNIFEIFFGPTLYPGGLFSGTLRFVFMFAVPSLFVGTIPVEILRDLDYMKVEITWIVSLIWLTIVIVFLNRSVKFYESTNLVGARVG